MPNFVHSLDSAALALLGDFYFNGKSGREKSFFAIHDCFAVTSNNMENLIEYLRLVYSKIYSDKIYLRELDKQIKSYIKSVYKESFDEKTGIIKIDDITLEFPDVEYVLDTKLDAKKFKYDSAYLIA
jgi:DNA-directed RNA polymerase